MRDEANSTAPLSAVFMIIVFILLKTLALFDKLIINFITILVSPVVSTRRVTAFEESCHRFISTSCLNLHEICSLVTASWAIGVSGVYVLPSLTSAHNMINFLKVMKI